MKQLVKAFFTFADCTVEFDGKRITVWLDCESLPSLEIEQGEWRPCVTHCRELIRLASGKEPRGQHARKRRKVTKPAFKVFDWEKYEEPTPCP